ncbi:MAG TPA: hypothetical protein VKR27_01810 [Acidimicrobiales bacterium]|nr:hypothetical protein [Acidimicrobiales bacterium]
MSRGALYLPVTTKYENSGDINEGRFTDDFVARIETIQGDLRRAEAVSGVQTMEEFRANLDQLSEESEDDLDLALAWAMSGRECSFVSCWTLGQAESPAMWRDFGDDSTGVVIQSTIRRVSNELEHVLDEDSKYDGGREWRLLQGPITYDRQDIHAYLSHEIVGADSAFLVPLFFLDGGVRSYAHEEEYRFVAYNIEELAEAAADRLQDVIAPKGTYVRSGDAIRRTVINGAAYIEVEAIPHRLLTGIIFGSQISPGDARSIEDLLRRFGLASAIKGSAI